jgi:hypothetical protein
MQEHYSSFLDFRAMQRRLAARFSQPRGLLLHTLIFITAMSAIWAYGLVWRLWQFRENYVLPMLIGAAWSVVLAIQALLHYQHSAARTEQREMAVEEEMRQFIQAHGDEVGDQTLFEMHRQLGADLQWQSRWSVALLAFGLVNAVSWALAAYDMGTTWAFQLTVPLAVFILGGVNLFLAWQQQRESGRTGWLTRLPLRHIIVYGVGAFFLGLAGSLRLINSWDADNGIVIWGVVVLLHIIWGVLLQPVMQHFRSGKTQLEQPAKRKIGRRLALAEDGEVLDIMNEDWASSDAGTLQQRS